MKRRIFYTVLIVCFGAYFAGQYLIAAADSMPEPIALKQVESCTNGGDQTTVEGEIYFSVDGDCLHNADTDEGSAERVPTAIKLVYSGSEPADPVSITGIALIFFSLVILTAGWLTLIRNWNRASSNLHP